ncbi:MAG: RNA 2',3'-cyclic phosphodiesterase [Chitinispirillaceae bacterium]|nr:RNA 2',3'-cyclic phosphodiesterase [Chitinispirillaceae bacterium]
MSRLFVAIDLPERIKDDIAATYVALPGARWVDETRLHLTLRFIGEVPGDVANRIAVALGSVSGPPFTLAMESVGFFPPRREPRILWAGIAENQEMMRLQARIERCLTSIGIDPDGRKFHPHVTIARLNGTPAHKVALYVTHNSLFSTEQFSVSAFHLYESFPRKDGAHHIKIGSYQLN